VLAYRAGKRTSVVALAASLAAYALLAHLLPT